MAKNFVKPGNVVTLTAPTGGVVSGLGYLIGSLFVVATVDVAQTLPFEGAVEGVWSLLKTSAQAWTEGQKIYWNTATNLASNDSSTGPLIGVAVAAAANPSATGQVRLNSVAASDATPVIESATVAALGSIQGDAALVDTGFTFVTGADAVKGVRLPLAAAGKQVVIKNGAAAVLKVWPATGDGINAIAVDSALSMGSLTSAVFTAHDATTWYTTPLVPS